MLAIAALVSATASPAPEAVSSVTSTPSGLFAALGSVAVTALTAALIWLGRALKNRLQRVLDQTENSHQSADFPNLRDELTATRKAAEAATEAAVAAGKAVADLSGVVTADRTAARKEVEGVREDVRGLSHRLDLHIAQGPRT